MKVAGVLLAAGTGSRFIDPEHKLLTNLHGEPLVTHAARSMTESTLDGYAVVTGAVELNKALTQFTELQIVENPQFDQGIATSLNAATAWALAHDFDALVVGLGDQPGVPNSAWGLLAQTNSPIAVATYDGKPGNPVRLEKSVWSWLPSTGDEGARVLIRARPDLVEQVACEGSSDDVDTVEDLRRWN